MAPFAFSIEDEGKDSAISCEGDGAQPSAMQRG